MTDPRVEAGARALRERDNDIDASWIDTSPETFYKEMARVCLAAADAVDPVRVEVERITRQLTTYRDGLAEDLGDDEIEWPENPKHFAADVIEILTNIIEGEK